MTREPTGDDLTRALLDECVRTGGMSTTPPGGWTVPRIVAAIRDEARAAVGERVEAIKPWRYLHDGGTDVFVPLDAVLAALASPSETERPG